MSFLGFLGFEFKNNIAIFENQCTQICQIAKFCELIKMPKLRTKMPDLGSLELQFQKNYCHATGLEPTTT